MPCPRRGNVSPVEEPVRVLIVDDHAVVRSGLRLLLNANDDIDVVSHPPALLENPGQIPVVSGAVVRNGDEYFH